jgi:AcrR family transcriptional regulator
MTVTTAIRKVRQKADVPAKAGGSAAKVGAVPSHRSAQAPLRSRALKTKQHLIDTAMALFLQRGYVATTIENIADAAEVSRASFYTYFSSKREIMMVAGHDCRIASWQLFEEFAKLDPDNLLPGTRAWVAKYFKFLEQNGGYLLMWQQAALQDPDLRQPGMRGSLKSAKILAKSLRDLGIAKSEDDLLIRSIAIMSLLDRFWYHWWIVKAPFTRKQVLDNLSNMIVASIQN